MCEISPHYGILEILLCVLTVFSICFLVFVAKKLPIISNADKSALNTDQGATRSADLSALNKERVNGFPIY